MILRKLIFLFAATVAIAGLSRVTTGQLPLPTTPSLDGTFTFNHTSGTHVWEVDSNWTLSHSAGPQPTGYPSIWRNHALIPENTGGDLTIQTSAPRIVGPNFQAITPPGDSAPSLQWTAGPAGVSTLRLGDVFQNGPAGGSTRVHWNNTSGNPDNMVLDLNGFEFLHNRWATGFPDMTLTGGPGSVFSTGRCQGFSVSNDQTIIKVDADVSLRLGACAQNSNFGLGAESGAGLGHWDDVDVEMYIEGPTGNNAIYGNPKFRNLIIGANITQGFATGSVHVHNLTLETGDPAKNAGRLNFITSPWNGARLTGNFTDRTPDLANGTAYSNGNLYFHGGGNVQTIDIERTLIDTYLRVVPDGAGNDSHIKLLDDLTMLGGAPTSNKNLFMNEIAPGSTIDVGNFDLLLNRTFVTGSGSDASTFIYRAGTDSGSITFVGGAVDEDPAIAGELVNFKALNIVIENGSGWSTTPQGFVLMTYTKRVDETGSQQAGLPVLLGSNGVTLPNGWTWDTATGIVDNGSQIILPGLATNGTETISGDSIWTAATAGNWNTASNWSTQVPDHPNSLVIFPNATAPLEVTVNSDFTINRLRFDSAPHRYTIAGQGSLNFSANTGHHLPGIDVIVGNPTLAAQVVLHANTTANLDANTSLAITSMDLHGNQLTKTGTGTLLINDQSNTHTLGAIDCQEGICSGDGTVGGNLSNHAVVSPGNGIGVLTVNGNFGQDENGTLLIELLSGGGVAGTDYDHFYVAGTAHLAGALDLDIVAGHGITIGDRLPSIVTAGMISGIFSTVSGAAIDGRKGLAVTYSNTSVDVDVALRGNTDVANGDTDVDTGDLTTSIINFTSAEGKGKTWADGDMDGDGDVDTGDLTTSIINFTGAQRATALPEPGGLLLLTWGLLGCIPLRRSR